MERYLRVRRVGGSSETSKVKPLVIKYTNGVISSEPRCVNFSSKYSTSIQLLDVVKDMVLFIFDLESLQHYEPSGPSCDWKFLHWEEKIQFGFHRTRSSNNWEFKDKIDGRENTAMFFQSFFVINHEWRIFNRARIKVNLRGLYNRRTRD